MFNFFEIILEIGYVFCGFILGIYFERNSDKKRDRIWLKKALGSIKHDLDLDYRLFSKTISVDNDQIEYDREIFNKIDKNTSISDFIFYLDQMKDNTHFAEHFGNLTHEDFDFIDLNRVNYDSFLKFGTKDDSIDDNNIKAQLDWIFEGATYIYRENVKEVRKLELQIDDFCTRIGYSKEFKHPIPENFDEVFIIQFKALYSNYLILRQKHITIKERSIVNNLKKVSELIEKIID
tara:strand:- start:291 stop:995 length:705 start_codon:yes stop_codon:yes gene_type:complete